MYSKLGGLFADSYKTHHMYTGTMARRTLGVPLCVVQAVSGSPGGPLVGLWLNQTILCMCRYYTVQELVL